MSTSRTPGNWWQGHDDLTGNLLAMPARTMPIDVGSKYAIIYVWGMIPARTVSTCIIRKVL